MKKYILPAAIIILSFLFLHTFIDDGKKEPVETKSYDLPQILSRQKKVDAVFLSKGDRKITNKVVAEAAKKAATVELDPNEEASVQLGANQSGMQLSEWDLKKGKITGKLEPYFIPGAINRLDTRIILIRTETEGKPITFLTKVKMKKMFSYQELLHPELDGYTLLVFSEKDEDISDLALNSQKYITREVKGTVQELNKKYPDLQIRKLPSIYIHQGMMRIFKSEDMNELRSLITGVVSSKYIGENENWHAEVNIKQSISDKKAEFLITYKGNDEMTGDIDVLLNSEAWSWGFGAGKLQEGTLTVSQGMDFFISKSDKPSITISQGGKEEQITLEYIGDE